jgi:hypothetical protein
VDARDSFIFTVANPFGDGIVKLPLILGTGDTGNAMYCDGRKGPIFGFRGIGTKTAGDNAEGVFDRNSYYMAGGTFGDPLKRGVATMTGAENFVPREIEVWRVIDGTPPASVVVSPGSGTVSIASSPPSEVSVCFTMACMLPYVVRLLKFILYVIDACLCSCAVLYVGA